jgi:hypothetical protein
MSYLVREIEGMIAQYIDAKYDEDALRMLSGSDLETTMSNDEDAMYDFKERLLYIILQEVDWNKIVTKAQENLADEEETNDDDD